MRRRVRSVVTMVGIGSLVAWGVRAQAPSSGAGAPNAPPPAIATVGTLRIPKAEFERASPTRRAAIADARGRRDAREYRPQIRRQLSSR